MNTSSLANFVENLPPQLRIAASIHIYQKTFTTHPFFKGLGNRRILAFFGERFRPKFYQTGDYLYRQGDDITNFQIATKGLAAFVKPRY